jgi:hypothetical protein
MRILFVDDDKSHRSLFDDAVDAWNEQNHPRSIQVVPADAVAEAKIVLEQQRIDGAVFDLRLPETAGMKSTAKSGNELAHLSLGSIGIPIGIVSGHPGDLDEDLKNLHMLRRFDKGDTDVYEQIVNWLDEQWLMMTILRSTRQQIEASGAEIFTKRLWPRWQTYAGLIGDDHAELARIVTRQYVSHVAELLGLDTGENAPWHPYECYIRPVLLETRAHTGDIFQLNDGLWIVLTPQCDMALGRITNVLLARIDEEPLQHWKDNVAKLKASNLSQTKINDRNRFFLDLVNQNIEISSHFLPPIKDGLPVMVRFKEIITRPLSELNACLDRREASIAIAFLPNLIQRFGAYITRTGQPNIDFRHFA